MGNAMSLTTPPPSRPGSVRTAAPPPRAAHVIGVLRHLAAFIIELVNNPAAIHDEHAVHQVDHLGYFGEVQQHRAAGTRVVVDQHVDLVLGTDVDAARGIEQQQHPAAGEDPLRQSPIFCWLPPEKAPVRR